jgi:hypothetical protein
MLGCSEIPKPFRADLSGHGAELLCHPVRGLSLSDTLLSRSSDFAEEKP